MQLIRPLQWELIGNRNVQALLEMIAFERPNLTEINVNKKIKKIKIAKAKVGFNTTSPNGTSIAEEPKNELMPLVAFLIKKYSVKGIRNA